MHIAEQLTTALAGRYAILREIGAGGMATVYLARDIKHDRQVALKVLKPELGAVLGVERFLAEIKVTANLQHPNLLPLFDSGEAEGLLFYVMPYVEGESLRHRLDREQQLPVDEAIRIAVGVANALAYAHAHGVIHRDLKPENILLQSGQPVVADFGIALAVSKAGGERITQTGLSLGTPQYMSPEQATGDRAVDVRTDIYSLGALTYEMLAGEPPHSGPTAQSIIAKLMTEEVRPITVLRRSVPLHVDAAVRRALEKLAADRFGSAAQFADALEGKIDRAAISRYGAANAGSATVSKLRRWRFVAAAALALTGVATAGWWTSATRRDDVLATVRFTLDFPTAFRFGNVVQGQGSEFAISPDGGTVAIIGSGGGSAQMLFIRALDDLQPHAVPGSEGASGPFFSPDGKWIGFFATGQLKKFAVSGGPVIPVSAMLNGAVYGATWGANDDIVLANTAGLAAVSANGGTVRQIFTVDSASGSWSPRWPYLLPDGKTVLVTRWTASPTSARLAAVHLDGGKATELDLPGSFPLGMLDGQLVYAGAAGSLMAVPFDVRTLRHSGTPQKVVDSVVAGGNGVAEAALADHGTLVYRSGANTSLVVLADARGGTQPLIAEPRSYQYVRLSPDGRRVALTIATGGSSDIWIHDLASRVTTRLTTEGTTNDRPEWSPDGKRVIFRSDRGNAGFSLWWQPADLSGPAEPMLPTSVRDIWEGVLSPDGRTLVYRTGTMGAADIWSRTLGGAPTPTPFANTPALEWGARISPDGRWIAYESNESGTKQVYVRPFVGGGARIQVSADSGSTPLWSHDGRKLFYVKGQKMLVAMVSTTPVLSVATPVELFEGDFTYLTGHTTFDVTAGDQLVVIKPTQGDVKAVVAYNWRAELRARTGAKATR
ncbi:MAG TPA: protein kinase [Gemmatimonadaceae bacterium]|nr:protein kinase [Gemmatimonadaceae bacterium]